jgi:polyhydroxyalkanoate synthase
MLQEDDVELMPTPRARIGWLGGTAALYHFETPEGAPRSPALPLLIVPSLINRWYVVDLRRGASLVEGLTGAGIDTYCLDWGIPEDEDRYLAWDEVIARIRRAVRKVKRITGAPRVGILGYCMGSTVSGIYAALHPTEVAAFVNLAGPFDFAAGGTLAELVDARWFDPDAVADAGNVGATQMQAGFAALRPTMDLSKWVRTVDTAHDPAARRAAKALEAWASDNIPFPGEAYRTYIRELYQQNKLINGEHRVGGVRVDLGAIRCPVLTIVASRDAICPADAATALNDACGSRDTQVLTVPGGHVGAVVGGRAAREMYPAAAAWLRQRLGAVTLDALDGGVV